MRGNFIQAITSSVFKLALLVAVVVLGIIFIPDDFMAKVERNVAAAGSFIQGEASKRAPGLGEEFNKKIKSTREDMGRLYQTFQEKTWPEIKNWISSHQLERQ
jgi:hypothetical protein